MASRKDPRKAGNAPPQRAGPAPQAKVAYDPTALKAADKLIPKTKLREVLLRDGHEERRIQSFRGRDLVEEIQRQKLTYGGITADTEEKAIQVAEKLLNAAPSAEHPRLFHMCDTNRVTQSSSSSSEKVVNEKKGNLYVVQLVAPIKHVDGSMRFESDKRFVLLYTPHDRMKYVYLTLLVLLVVAITSFRAWPMSLRTVTWYISVTLLLVLLGTIAIQLTVLGLCWMVGYEVWILPGLWADVDSFSKLFKPFITVEKSAPVSIWVRPAAVIVLLSCCAYIYMQTPDLETFVAQQKQFVDDLYAGTLLGDGTEVGGGSTWFSGGGKRANIPKVEDIEKMFADSVDPTPTPGSAEPDMDRMLNEEM